MGDIRAYRLFDFLPLKTPHAMLRGQSMSVEATTGTQPVAPATPPTVPAPEKPTTEVKEAPKPAEDTSAKRFAALAKKEKAIQKQVAEAKALAEQVAKERAEYEAWKKQKAEEEDAWNRNPLDALSKRGWDYKKLTEMVLAGENPTPEMVAKLTAQEELKAWQKSQEAERQRQAEEAAQRAREEEEKAFQDYRVSLTEHIAANSDKYEYCKLFEGHSEDLAVEVQKQHYAKSQRVLSKDEALELVEKYYEGLVDKATTTKKYVAKATPQPKAEEKPSTPAQPRTLTNQLTPSANATRSLTREERIQRALAIGKK